MKRIIPLILLALFGYHSNGLAQLATNRPPPEEQERIIREIQQSHIDDNVPSAVVFQEYLTRDISQYIRQLETNEFKTKIELLRDGPTQSGIAYPKFYVWVIAGNTNQIMHEGAMRVSAIEGKKFEVTSFVKKSDIVTNPKAIDAIFPQALLAKIRVKAGLKD